MTTPLQQMTAISAQLSVDLATVTDDRLIELCLLYRSEPDAYRAFADNLKEEIIRRFTAEEIANNDVMFSVIKNFSNQFSSSVPYFAKKMLEMAASVNRDIWFNDNLVMMQSFASDLDAMNWLVEPKQADVLAKVLNNTYGLKVIANSLVASTAVLSHQPSVDIWKAVPFLWDTGFWVSYKNGMDVLSKSSELASYVAASSTAMTAVAASSTAMTAVAASSTAMTAVAASSTAMTAVAASSTALSAIVKSTSARNALMSNNTILQASRAAIFTTINSNWTMVRRLAYNQYDAINAKQNYASPYGFVFAYLGGYGVSNMGKMTMFHPNNTPAASGETRIMDNTVFVLTGQIDSVSFDGMSLGSSGASPRASIELWTPPA